MANRSEQERLRNGSATRAIEASLVAESADPDATRVPYHTSPINLGYYRPRFFESIQITRDLLSAYLGQSFRSCLFGTDKPMEDPRNGTHKGGILP